MAPAMLRVMPTSDLPCPTHDGRKHGRLHRKDAPKEGHLVVDNVFHRRRIAFGELQLIAEGDAALEGYGADPMPAPAQER